MLKSRKLLAAEFNISIKTLSRRLKKASIDIPKGLLCMEYQQLIYKLLTKK
jgi:hypothetical protein